MKELTDRNYIRLHSLLINSRYSLSNAEIDIILAIMTAIKKEDENGKEYFFTKTELSAKMGKKIDTKQLKTNIKNIMSKPLEIYQEEKNKWGFVHWFSHFVYDNGKISCAFDKHLLPYLINLQNQFAYANYKVLLKMSSTYSKRIYLMLKEYQKIGSRRFKIADLQKQLQVTKSLLSYSNFNLKVLSKAVEDINKYSDLTVTLSKEHKLGRKIVGVTFTIRKNWNSLEDFISTIREYYSNEPLWQIEEDGVKKIIKCSGKGHLYFSDDTSACIDKKRALHLWQVLYKNKEKLIFIVRNRIEMERKIQEIGGEREG